MQNSEQPQIYPKLRQTISEDYQPPSRLNSPLPNVINSQNPVSRKNENDKFGPTEKEKIVVDRVQLREFTKNYANEKIEREEEVEKLREEVHQRDETILKLEQKINDLKIEEEYLLKSIEELRDKNPPSSLLDSKAKLLKMKEMDIEHLKKENGKLKQWLKEEKEEGLKCLECVKMKDVIIEGLEQQVKEIKEQLKAAQRKRKNTDQSSKNEESLKEISLKEHSLKDISFKEESQKEKSEKEFSQDDLLKERERSSSLEEQIRYLTEYIENLKNDPNYIRVQRNPKTKVVNYPEAESPILKLITKSSELANHQPVLVEEINVNKRKYDLLSKKCLYLESQLEKFVNASNNILIPNSRNEFPLKNERERKGIEEVLKEEHFEFC